MPLLQLDGKQTKQIMDALEAAFPLEANFRNVVLFANHNLDSVSSPGQPLGTRILESIKHAEANDWLIELLDSALQVNSDPVIRALRDGLEMQIPPDDISPYYMCRLGGGTVMVDRKPLRAAVQELGDRLGRRILVITGESRSGKSHSLQLITFISEVVGGFGVVAVDLDPRRDDQTRLVIKADDLAQRIIRLCGYPIAVATPPSDAQWAKWVTQFGDDFEGKAALEAQPRWIVIDGMNKVMLDQSAVDLVHDLSTRIHGRLAKLRLVLVGYEQSLPSLVSPYIQQEKILRISTDDLTEFFLLAHEEMRVPPNEDDLAGTISRILSQVDMKSGDYLIKLGPLVAQELLRIKKGP